MLKVKMAVVNPETASVTTTTDSSLKIRLNQITKQTAKRINSDLSSSLSLPLFSIRRTLNLQSIKSLQMIFYFTLRPLIFWSHVFGVKLFLLSVNSALLFCLEASRNCFTKQGIISVFKNIFHEVRHESDLGSDAALLCLLSPVML